MKILDATYVPVCASLFPWANFQPSKNAVNSTVSGRRFFSRRSFNSTVKVYAQAPAIFGIPVKSNELRCALEARNLRNSSRIFLDSPSGASNPPAKPRLCSRLGHRNPKKVFGTSFPKENPLKFLFLTPNPLVDTMIAQVSLKK